MTLPNQLFGTVPGTKSEFASTHWSIVHLAGGGTSPESLLALEQLCRSYWYPLYAFVRREGHSPEEAADLTQEFFFRLLAGDYLTNVSRDKGRFRSFLLASMRHLLANEWKRSQRQKRGGSLVHFSLNATDAEQRYQLDPPTEVTPESLYERHWAETVLDAVTRRLQEEFIEAGMDQRFDELKVYLLDGDEPPTYADAAARLGMTEGAVRTAIFRMRRRYGELFREELAHTVNSARDLEEEIRHFVAVLAR